MTPSLPHSPDAAYKGCPCPKTRSWTLPFFAAGILAILVNAKHRGVEHDDFCDSLQVKDISSTQFDAGVHKRVQQLCLKVPAMAMLVSAIQKDPTITIHFLNEDSILDRLLKMGMTPKDANEYITKTTYSEAFLPEDRTGRLDPIYIYLSRNALVNEEIFTQSLLREYLHAWMDRQMPSTLSAQKRIPDAGGLIVNGPEVKTEIGKNFTKKCISRLVAQLIMDSHGDGSEVYSLGDLLKYLKDGRVHPKDLGNQAFQDFLDTLKALGFPIENMSHESGWNSYIDYINIFYPNMAKITEEMCRQLKIPVQS